MLAEVAPDAVLVYGDTNSTLGGALVAAKAQVPLAHVEAGMRSFNRSMPEEVNRVVADALSALSLCPTEAAMANLRDEGLGEAAVLVGDVMADVALIFGPIADQRSDALERLGLEQGASSSPPPTAPATSTTRPACAPLVEVLARAAEEAPVVFAVHPRTRARLEAEGLLEGLAGRGIRATDPLGYLDITRLVRASRAVLTDSGGLQKEAFLASVPCVTMREETEWVETVESGWNRLVGLDPEAAAAALAELPKPSGKDGNGTSPAAELYGGGHAGERVAEALAKRLGPRP